MKLLPLLRNSRRLMGILPRRVAAQILVVSSLVTFFLTCFQLFSEWRTGVSGRRERIDALESSFIPQLSRAVWSMDTEQIDLIAMGIKKSASATFLAIKDVSGQAPILSGTPGQGDKIEREFPLSTLIGGVEKRVGTILVQTELGSLYQELFKHLWEILLGQTLKTFLVTFAIMLIIRRMITRHLISIADWAEASVKQSPNAGAPVRITLARRDRNGEADELDKLVESINSLNTHMSESLERIRIQSAERHALQEELIQATQQASVTQTVSGVLHDVNNFLTIVAGYVPILERLVKDAEASMPAPKHMRLTEVISKVSRATDAALQVASLQLRTFSMSEGATTLDVDSLIESVLLIQQNFLAKQKVRVEFVGPTGFRCFAMQGAVVTILINLIKNSVEAMTQEGFRSSESPVIKVSARLVSEARSLTISVTDNGPGIKEESLTKVFDGGFTTKKTGHGLGLHFCRNLAQRSGGNLTATSAGIGTGSTFYLTLPVEESALLPAPAQVA